MRALERTNPFLPMPTPRSPLYVDHSVSQQLTPRQRSTHRRVCAEHGRAPRARTIECVRACTPMCVCGCVGVCVCVWWGVGGGGVTIFVTRSLAESVMLLHHGSGKS